MSLADKLPATRAISNNALQPPAPGRATRVALIVVMSSPGGICPKTPHGSPIIAIQSSESGCWVQARRAQVRFRPPPEWPADEVGGSGDGVELMIDSTELVLSTHGQFPYTFYRSAHACVRA